MNKFDHVILGCGVSGLCAAKMLSHARKSSILILDKYAEPGGNQISREINGFTFDIGAFYYWPSMPLFEMYPEILEQCLERDIKIQRVSPAGDVGPFPFSLKHEFLDKGFSYCLRAVGSVMRARMRSSPITTAEDFAVYWMGEHLYNDLGLRSYIERFFGMPANCIEAAFAISRMQGVAQRGQLKFWLEKGHKSIKKRVMPQGGQPKEILLVRPEKGFPWMYRPAVKTLSQLGVEVRLNQNIKSIRKEGQTFVFTTGNGVIRTNNLINTVPVQHICKYLNLNVGTDLECVTLATMFISFTERQKFDGAILYNWGALGRWKRLTMHSDYYGSRNGMEYASVEIPIFRSPNIDIQELFADFVSSSKAYGILNSPINLEGFEIVENAYPAHITGASDKLKKVISVLSGLGVQSIGRQGRFDYLPTGEQVVKQVQNNLKV